MVRGLLVRGMLAGLAGGALAFAFAWAFGEPQVNLAIAFETHMHQMAGDPPEPELVSRAVQGTIGLMTGVLVYGAALGGIFALAFAYAQGRVGRLGPRATAAVLAAGGFIALILAPQIKYPANPPSIGNPETIGSRTALYFTMIALSVIAAVAAASTGRQLARRLGGWNAAIAAGGAYLAVIAAGMLIPAAGQRGAGRVLGRDPVEFPARLARHRGGAVDWARADLRRALAERQLAQRGRGIVRVAR